MADGFIHVVQILVCGLRALAAQANHRGHVRTCLTCKPLQATRDWAEPAQIGRIQRLLETLLVDLAALHLSDELLLVEMQLKLSSGSVLLQGLNVPQYQIQRSRKGSSQLRDAILRRKKVERFMAFFRAPLKSNSIAICLMPRRICLIISSG